MIRIHRTKFLISVIVIAFAIWGFIIEPGLLVEKRLRIPKWTGPNFKIAFFSDLHAGAPHIDAAYIESLVQKINTMKPDLILIGGDLVINGVIGGKAMPIEILAPLLAKLSAPHGVFAVRGNHDWWNDGEKIKTVLEANEITVLENEARLISVNSIFKFWLVGIGDAFTNHANTQAAFAQVTTAAPKILFMHDPAALFQIKEPFFLTLSGHLHGGQVYVPGIGALITPGDAPKEWASGWINHELGTLFVSKGIGTSILPVRINSLPEFVILSLEK